MGVRKARVEDVPAIHALVNHFARREQMLALSLSDVYERLRDFFVFEEGGEVAGCCAVHVVWEDLAEVRSLAVREEVSGRGVGRALFAACVAEAPGLGVRRVFALSFVPEFFENLGMARTAKEALPHKVWADCVKCPHFPNCGEVALIADVDERGLVGTQGGAEGG